MVMDPLAAIEDKAMSYGRVDGEWQSPIVAGSPTSVPEPSKPRRASWSSGPRSTGSRPSVRATINAERFDDCGRHSPRRGRDAYGAGIIERDVGERHRPGSRTRRSWDGFDTTFRSPRHTASPFAVSCNSPTRVAATRQDARVDLLTAWIGSS